MDVSNWKFLAHGPERSTREKILSTTPTRIFDSKSRKNPLFSRKKLFAQNVLLDTKIAVWVTPVKTFSLKVRKQEENSKNHQKLVQKVLLDFYNAVSTTRTQKLWLKGRKKVTKFSRNFCALRMFPMDTQVQSWEHKPKTFCSKSATSFEFMVFLENFFLPKSSFIHVDCNLYTATGKFFRESP